MVKRTTKKTKEEVSQAFNELSDEKQAQAGSLITKSDAAESEREKMIVESASGYTPDNIIKNLAELQVNFNGTIRDLSSNLTKEALRLQELRDAVRIEEKYIKDLYNIDVVANTIDILLREHEEKTKKLNEELTFKKNSFEVEMAEKKNLWKKEQDEYERSKKERNDLMKKEHERELEEYEYNLEKSKSRDEFEYNDRKLKMEKELEGFVNSKKLDLSNREQKLIEREKLFEEYKSKVEKYPIELENAVKKAREDAIRESENSAKHKYELFAKTVEGNQRVYEEKIKSLEQIIANQNHQIENLSIQLKVSLNQIQDLAGRVIDGNAKISSFQTISDIAIEQAKGISKTKTA